MILKRIGPLSLAKVLTILYAIMGLIIGILYAVLGSVVPKVAETQELPAYIFGPLAIIIMPIFYAVIGFLGGLIGAWLYNLVAGLVGGIRLDLK